MSFLARLILFVFGVIFLIPLGGFCLRLLLARTIRRAGGELSEQEKMEAAPEAKDPKSAARERAWEEYKLYAGFFQFFLDFGLKANVFFYGITGVILTILYNSSGPRAELSLRERLGTEVLVLLLGTPLMIGVALAVAFIWGAHLWENIAKDIEKLRNKRELELRVTPHLHYLTVMLTVFGVIFLFVSGVLVWVISAI